MCAGAEISVQHENGVYTSTQIQQTQAPGHTGDKDLVNTLMFTGETQVFDTDTLFQQCQRNIFKLPLAFWWQGIKARPKTQSKELPWTKILVTGTAITGCYLILSSIFLFGLHTYYQEQINALSDQSEMAISVRQTNRDLQTELNKRNALLSQQIPHWTIWPSVELALAQKANITALFANSEEVRLIGNVERASDLLAKLQSSPFTENVDFSRAVTENRRFRNQNFQISWQLSQVNESERNSFTEITEEIDTYKQEQKAALEEAEAAAGNGNE